MSQHPDLDQFLKMDIEEAFKSKMWVYVPVVNKHGSALGIAVAKEYGYSPVPKFIASDYDEAQDLADRLNTERGFTPEQSLIIQALSMRKPTTQKDKLIQALENALAKIDDEIEQRKFSGNEEDWLELQTISDEGHAAIKEKTVSSNT